MRLLTQSWANSQKRCAKKEKGQDNSAIQSALTQMQRLETREQEKREKRFDHLRPGGGEEEQDGGGGEEG